MTTVNEDQIREWFAKDQPFTLYGLPAPEANIPEETNVAVLVDVQAAHYLVIEGMSFEVLEYSLLAKNKYTKYQAASVIKDVRHMVNDILGLNL